MPRATSTPTPGRGHHHRCPNRRNSGEVARGCSPPRRRSRPHVSAGPRPDPARKIRVPGPAPGSRADRDGEASRDDPTPNPRLQHRARTSGPGVWVSWGRRPHGGEALRLRTSCRPRRRQRSHRARSCDRRRSSVRAPAPHRSRSPRPRLGGRIPPTPAGAVRGTRRRRRGSKRCDHQRCAGLPPGRPLGGPGS